MTAKIGVSTGVFYKHFNEEEINKMIHLLRNSDIDVVEILYARPFMLDIKISDDNKLFLDNKEVLIHAPFFKNQGYENVVYDGFLIKKLIEKSKLLNAKHIIIHPDLIPDFKLIEKFQKIFVFENLKEDRTFTMQKIASMIDSEMEIKFSLDIGHLNKEERSNIAEIIKKYSHRLAEIQLSIKDDYDDFLTGNINKKYSFLIGLEIPIIFETRLKKQSHLSAIIKNLRQFVTKKVK